MGIPQYAANRGPKQKLDSLQMGGWVVGWINMEFEGAVNEQLAAAFQ